MNFTFNIAELLGIIGAALVAGGLVESVRRLTVSSGSQGRRLGDIDKWIADHDGVARERERVRRRADTRGIPIPEGSDE